ncbi:unnamed protein product [Urochloa decumbens]|uniref:F-box protein AT5G49610-like beta-propeller domain-containing protein n=1 Tax=Urochloa decumbens TaxID=240449 RepID=A0ABC9A226_9POAL
MPPAAAESSSSVSLVLRSQDLLGEILLRVGFPTTLVRAALACKRWLRVASDPAFLRLFRARHPPRLLGFYATGCSRIGPAEFWPVRHPPELASAVARAASILDALPGCVTDIVDCRHGRLHVCFSRGSGYSSNGDGDGELEVVLSPLQYPAGGAVMLQLPPAPGSAEHSRCYRLVTHTAAFHQHSIQFLAENGGDGLQCFELEQTYYRNNRQTNLKLLKADDSRVYLVTVRREQLRFWQHRSVSGSVGNWLLVDTVYLDKIFSNLGTPVGFFKVTFVGDNAEFVLLQSGRRFYYIDIRCGTIEEVVQRDSFSGIWPLMMI